MAKNRSQSMLDMGQIWKRLFQSEHDALRVVHATDLETEFSLSHEDGDSILSKKESKVLPANQEADAKHLSQVMAYSDGNITLKAGDLSFTTQIKAGQVLPICALTLLADVALVGQ